MVTSIFSLSTGLWQKFISKLLEIFCLSWAFVVSELSRSCWQEKYRFWLMYRTRSSSRHIIIPGIIMKATITIKDIKMKTKKGKIKLKKLNGPWLERDSNLTRAQTWLVLWVNSLLVVDSKNGGQFTTKKVRFHWQTVCHESKIIIE